MTTPNAPVTTVREPIKVIADIISHEMGIDPGLIMLADEKNNIPSIEGLYIDLAYIGPSQAIGNNNYMVVNLDSTATEVMEVAMRHMIQIDALSFNSEARLRKEEILMALASQYSQNQQELYLMSIARIPSGFLDASSLEETVRLKRFTTTIVMTALHRKTKASDYYDDFKPVEVHENA